MEERFLHVDMNAFYASVEQAKNPDLKGKPVIVCGDPGSRGVVSAASYEARRYGVRSAMPAVTAKKLCPDGVFVPVRMDLYMSVSSEIFDMLGDFSPVVEPVSVDEAFLDLLGCEVVGTPAQVAREIKRHIRSAFDITCSIGIAPNRLLAKLASDMQKPDGLVVIHRCDIPRVVWPLPVERLIGVGEKTGRRLRDLGIITIGQLAKAPLDLLSEKFGVTGPSMALMARGEEDLGWRPQPKNKSIGRETTFSRDVSNPEVLRKELLDLCEDVCARLRSQRIQARTVHVKFRTPGFETYTRAVTLEQAIDATEQVFRAAWKLFSENTSEGEALRLIGVSLSGLIEADELRQATLPLEPTVKRHYHGAVDSLRAKYGKNAVVRASTLSIPPKTEDPEE